MSWFSSDAVLYTINFGRNDKKNWSLMYDGIDGRLTAAAIKSLEIVSTESH